MPYIRVTVTDPDLPAGTRHTLAEGLTDLAVSALGKDRSRTIVQIAAVEPDTYYVDGRPLTGGARDAHVEVSITLGSNSAAEKAAFIAQANELLTDTLGTLARSGVALHELPPESYGYHGVTQFDFYRSMSSAR
ncbi:tautomerase family protein [Streptomyces sp. NBC_00006]|uniref:tautomerase family protein n=1 Tax=Streptomyces sp. NBC_00006 TaxID=2975619 RepID=UPI0022556760|nr:tautomerase family protein [Streptomyces sp. NBC_00006]MCX5529296.1 tautomerase family protein [Streptomyces sp. NBC_00006]